MLSQFHSLTAHHLGPLPPFFARRLRAAAFASSALIGCSAASDAPHAGPNGSGGSLSLGGGPNVDGPTLPCDTTIGAGVDHDKDGFSKAQGDCNDCAPSTNPGAFDVPNNGIDEDCSGRADDEAASCDERLSPKASAAEDAARALGLCRKQAGDSWGLVSARWVFPDGTERVAGTDDVYEPYQPLLEGVHVCATRGTRPNPASRSILASFGDYLRPREGQRFVALSTGVARSGLVGGSAALDGGTFTGISPLGTAMCTTSRVPEGVVAKGGRCPKGTTGDATDPRQGIALDGIALELEIKVPTNAQSFGLEFDFYTTEFPYYVCNVFNDSFAVLLSSQHPSVPKNGSIAFDEQGNSIDANSAMLEVCDPDDAVKNPHALFFPCSKGPQELLGTGFDVNDYRDGAPPRKQLAGATGWLRTSSAIVPGETIRLRLAIWDRADEARDSTAVVDHFEWSFSQAPEVPVTVVVQ